MEKYHITDNFPFSIINFQLFSDNYHIRNHLRDCGHRNRFHSRRIRNRIRQRELTKLQFLLLSVRERQ